MHVLTPFGTQHGFNHGHVENGRYIRYSNTNRNATLKARGGCIAGIDLGTTNSAIAVCCCILRYIRTHSHVMSIYTRVYRF